MCVFVSESRHSNACVYHTDVQLIKQFFINGIHVVHRLWFEVTAAVTAVVTTSDSSCRSPLSTRGQLFSFTVSKL